MSQPMWELYKTSTITRHTLLRLTGTWAGEAGHLSMSASRANRNDVVTSNKIKIKYHYYIVGIHSVSS